MVSTFASKIPRSSFCWAFCPVFAFIHFLISCCKIFFLRIWSWSYRDLYRRLKVFCSLVFTSLHFGFLSGRALSRIGLMVALAICALSYNVNTQLSFSFAASINSTLVFISRVRTCAHYTFLWLISTVAFAFVTNSTTFHANRSRPGIPVLFYFFDGSSKSKTTSNKPLCPDLVTNSNNY